MPQLYLMTPKGAVPLRNKAATRAKLALQFAQGEIFHNGAFYTTRQVTALVEKPRRWQRMLDKVRANYFNRSSAPANEYPSPEVEQMEARRPNIQQVSLWLLCAISALASSCSQPVLQSRRPVADTVVIGDRWGEVTLVHTRNLEPGDRYQTFYGHSSIHYRDAYVYTVDSLQPYRRRIAATSQHGQHLAQRTPAYVVPYQVQSPPNPREPPAWVVPLVMWWVVEWMRSEGYPDKVQND